ncbi:MAG: response regulator, partial [Clostridia bacterium]|nr:response regulator [Clostridia bacterium]
MKVMLIDDSSTMRKIQRRVLETMGITDIVEAGNGKELTVNGNPIPGQFPYGEEYDPCVGSDTFEIPLGDWVVDDELFIAAHAVVQKPGGLDGLEGMLPDEVTMQVTFGYEGGPAYLPEVTVTGGTTLDGIYPGWCVNTGTNIERDRGYLAAVYSSYGAIPPSIIDHPENLDKVNWIINQGFVGQTGSNGTYTLGDVQRAIWRLVDDDPEHETYTGYDEIHVQEILAAAYAHGEGFVPGPGDLVAIVLVPEGGQ